MGFLSRLLGAVTSPSSPTLSVSEMTSAPEIVQLAGTTTNSSAGAAAAISRLDPAGDGYGEGDGVLTLERSNAAHATAVAIHAGGERVGYLPSYVADMVSDVVRPGHIVPVQLFAHPQAAGPRVEAWAWLGSGQPRWEWSSQNPPPMTPEAKRAAEHQATQRVVRDALAGGGARAAQFRAGMAGGLHYLETVEPIKQLKREGRLEEALELCHLAIDGTEASARREGLAPAPFYTEQAAIIYRKLGRRDEEVAILRRYIAACPAPTHENLLAVRLRKLLS